MEKRRRPPYGRAMPAGRPLKAIFAPSSRWGDMRAGHRPGDEPGMRPLFDALRAEDVEPIVVDQGEWPLNPLARRGPALASLDPGRAVRLGLFHRDADIIVSVFEGAAWSLVKLRRLLGYRVPIVIWDVSLTESWKLKERILDATIPKIDNVFLLDSSQAAYVERRWHPPYRPLVVGHQVDADFFAPQPGGGGGVLSVGDDVGRDFPTLCAAAEGLGAPVVVKSKGLHGVAGEPPANLRLVRERLSYDALRDLYANADVVAVPTRHTLNASGITSLLEAYAMGKAVVASDNPALGDYMKDGENCLTVPAGDRAALRAALRRLLDDAPLRERLGAAARAFVERDCTQRVLGRKMAAAMREVVAASRP